MSTLSTLKWLYPGMRVKRWLLLGAFGVLLVATGSLGVAMMANMVIFDLMGALNNFTRLHAGHSLSTVGVPAGLAVMVAGLVCLALAIRGLVHDIACGLRPKSEQRLADVIFRTRLLEQGGNIVVIGGGTGLSTMLRGLKEYTSNITAIVTVSDDGGSSGRLQREMGMLPPGDIRNCLIALADAEPEMRRALQHRFDGEAGGLSGHSLGNLFLAAMTQIHGGDFEAAVKEAGKVLAIRGTVLPSTVERVSLEAEMADGTWVRGESNITQARKRIQRIFLRPPDARPVPDALDAIAHADLIVLGPGSVYTSIIPNLLIPGIPEAIARSPALKVYICNVMTQPGETDGYTAADHVQAVVQHAGRRVFDYVLVNDRKPRADLLQKYEASGQQMVEPDVERIRAMGYQCIVGDFISETDLVRHDTEKLARAIAQLVE